MMRLFMCAFLVLAVSALAGPTDPNLPVLERDKGKAEFTDNELGQVRELKTNSLSVILTVPTNAPTALTLSEINACTNWSNVQDALKTVRKFEQAQADWNREQKDYNRDNRDIARDLKVLARLFLRITLGER